MRAMVVFRFITCLPLLLLLLSGCNSKSTRNAILSSGNETISLPDTFIIPYKQVVQIGENALSLRFDTIFRDSRCPEDVNCIWAGAFETGIELSDRDNKYYLKLGTYLKADMDTSLAGYTIVVVDLLPHPNTRVKHAKSDHKLVVAIDRSL